MFRETSNRGNKGCLARTHHHHNNKPQHTCAEKFIESHQILAMADIDQLFGQIESNIKDEETGRWSYIILNDADPQFNVKSHFPDSVSHTKTSKNGCPIIHVHFKTPADAEEASQKELDNVTISVPQHRMNRTKKRKSKAKAVPGKPTESSGEPQKKLHGWKFVKDIKILMRRHIKGLQGTAPSVAGDLRVSATFAREIAFLKAALQFLHTGANIVEGQADYFENHDQGEDVNYIKKARVSLETQVQERVDVIRAILQANKNNSTKQLAMKKLKKTYYCVEVLLRYFRGEKEPRLTPELMDLADIKEEVLSEDEREVMSEDGENEEQDSPVPTKKAKGRYFQL